MTENISIKKTVNLDFNDAVLRVKEVFKANGFGAITEIDVKKTLKEKINADFKKYIILGMCNPKVAMDALNMNDEIGLLLPCNVCIYEDKNNNIIVNAINPAALLNLINVENLKEKSLEIKKIIEKSINEI
ncbi:MAG: DUF302 domain-containing protein [bacterium]